MRLLVDANLPPQLATWLTDAGEDAVHLFAVAPHNADDHDIWTLAGTGQRVIISKDVDFAYLALARQAARQVLWVRCGNLTLRPFQAWFMRRWPSARLLLLDSEPLVELR